LDKFPTSLRISNNSVFFTSKKSEGAMLDNYRLLIEKLDAFIRKYYLNQLIRGSLYSIGLILFLFLATTTLEYFYYFSTTGRKLLFYSFIGVSAVALWTWVLSPLLKYFRLGQLITHEKAAEIVGSHFGNVKDKLLNILQLRHQADTEENKDLILASINQKSEEIKPVPFQAAINLNQNRKYLRFALPPLLLLLILLFAAPSIIRDSADRLLHNGREFLRPAPFKFFVPEDSLAVVQYEDYELRVKVEGAQLPNEVFINIDNYEYRLKKESPTEFTYTFSKVQKDVPFRLNAGDVSSLRYNLEVLKKPNIRDFEVKLHFPSYIGRQDELLNNVGDLVLPVGTKVDWIFNTESTDLVRLKFSRGQKTLEATRQGNDLFLFSKKAMLDESYKLLIANQALPKGDSVNYAITIIPDQYPDIRAERFSDSTNTQVQYFAGDASDDYGLRGLTFNYRIRKSGGSQLPEQKKLIQRPEGKQTQFEYSFDVSELGLQPGDELSYFFEVYDNDAVNGSKSARTGMMVYSMPTVKEMEAKAEKNDDKIKDNLKDALLESKKLENELKKLREKLLQEKDLNWQTRKQMEKLLDRQKELEKQIEEAKKAFEENQKNEEKLGENQDEQTEAKEEKMEELFKALENEEMKELMKQIEQMMQQMEKDQALKMMEEMKDKDEQRQMDLDRMLELFKQLELEQEMNKAIDKMEKLAKEEEKLSQETQKQEKDQQKDQQKDSQKDQQSQEDLKKKQEDVNKQFQEAKEQLDKVQKKNEELEKKKDLGDPQEEMKDIQRDLNDAKQELNEQKNDKASKSQKKAAQKMKNAANNMKMKMKQGEMEQISEDIASLRQLLENLVGLSFEQEDLMKDLTRTEINTPQYIAEVQRQFKIKDDFKLVEDSLQALSKRVFQIESFITEKVGDVKSNMRESLEELENREKSSAGNHQQRTMKNLNDLALMLSEVLNNMQQQMSSMMSGDQSCSKPGKQGKQGSAPQDKLTPGQQQLNGQMQKAKDGQQKDGQNGGPNAKEFAQMAAKQAAIRKALEAQQRKLQQQGKGSKQLQDLIDQMDKTETDLVNKRLTNEMMRRQKDIETRLLEHEKAQRERELDDQRKSETAKVLDKKIPPALEEYIKKRKAEVESYKTVSPALKPYYKTLVEEYFKGLKSGTGK
jgi:hypothetical protein